MPAVIIFSLPADVSFIYLDDTHWLPKVLFGQRGRAQPLRELNIDDGAVTALIERRWQQYSARQGAASMVDCVLKIQDQLIVTPASIAEEPDVELAYSDF